MKNTQNILSLDHTLLTSNETFSIPPEEYKFLAIILLSEDSSKLIADSHLYPQHFQHPLHQRLWEVLIQLHEEQWVGCYGNELSEIINRLDRIEGDWMLGNKDTESLKGMLREDINKLNKNTQKYEGALYIAYRNRKARSALIQALRSIQDGVGIDDIENTLFSSFYESADSSSQEAINVRDLMQEQLQSLISKEHGDKDVIPTPFYDLDDKTYSGFRKKELVIIAGRPGMGKTTLGLNFMYYVDSCVKEMSTLLFSIEMDRMEIAEKWTMMYAKINKHQLNKKVGELAVERFKNSLMCIDDSAYLPFSDLVRKIKRQKIKSPNLGLVMIDYLGLIQVKSDNRHSEVGDVVRGLKLLAKKLDICIVLLSQLNRECDTGRKPRFSDLAISGAVEQNADIVLMLYRKDINKPKELTIFVAKNRKGKVGDCDVHFLPNFSYFCNTQKDIEKYEKRKQEKV